MKMQQKTAAVSAAFLIITGCFLLFTVKTTAAPDNITVSGNIPTTNTVSGNTPGTDTVSKSDKAPDALACDVPPQFSAHIESSPQGYVVNGTFAKFPPDLCQVSLLYSLDGENWQICSESSYLEQLVAENPAALKELKNRACLHFNTEPLKSYLALSLNRFYLKLHYTRKDGTVGESQTVVIDRGNPQSLPDEFTPIAKFSSTLLVTERNPYCQYGRYQLTVRTDSRPEEISSFLPDTLPIEIQLLNNNLFVSGGVVDCPVTWKPLSLPALTAGESLTIPDAAEEIIIPAGTLLHTPTGIYQLDKPLRIDQFSLTDEVRLVLNVIGKDESPAGILYATNYGLDMTFRKKPTGATAIRVYLLAEGETEWTEIPNHSLLEAVNAQPSTANSSYALVLDNASKLFQSYMAAQVSGSDPSPFYIGLKIEGGVYHDRQLILSWPSTYPILPSLPKLGGSGGNEGNAGAGNKSDSTEEGQRPNLPQTSEQQSTEKSDISVSTEYEPPQNSSVSQASAISPDNDSIFPPFQNPEKISRPSKTVLPADKSPLSPLEPFFAADTGAGFLPETAVSEDSFSDTKLSAASITLDKPEPAFSEEKTDPNTGNSYFPSFFLAAAGVLVWLFLTKPVRRQWLSVLRKLHHKFCPFSHS